MVAANLYRMIKRFTILLIISQLLLNSMCATAHIAGNDHTSQHSPDLHLDSYHYADIHQVDELTAESKDSSEHQSHSHCHTHLQVFLISSDIHSFDYADCIQSNLFKVQLCSLSHTPPVPPPTV